MVSWQMTIMMLPLFVCLQPIKFNCSQQTLPLPLTQLITFNNTIHTCDTRNRNNPHINTMSTSQRSRNMVLNSWKPPINYNYKSFRKKLNKICICRYLVASDAIMLTSVSSPIYHCTDNHVLTCIRGSLMADTTHRLLNTAKVHAMT